MTTNSKSQQTVEEFHLRAFISRTALRARVEQAIKTGVAAAASLYAARLLKLPEGYWAVISALIVMQSNIGATVGASWSRLAGTAIGATIAGAFVTFWGAHPLSFIIAVTVAVLVCAWLGLIESYRLAGVTVAIVMLLNHNGSTWTIAIHRFLEVSLGIVVALLVSLVVWPSGARIRLRFGIAEAFKELRILYEAVIGRYQSHADFPDSDEVTTQLIMQLKQTMSANEEFLKQALYEPAVGALRYQFLELLHGHASRVFNIVQTLELATRESHNDSYLHLLEPELTELETSVSVAFARLSEEVESRRFTVPSDNLDAAVAALERKAASVRASGASVRYALEEVLRAYSFVLGLKNLAAELDLAWKEGARSRNLK